MKPLCEINGVVRHYPEGLVNLEEILLCMMEKELPENEMILEVKVDGKVYSEAYENQARELHLETVDKIEITTQAEEDFARDSIGEASATLDHLERGFGAAIRFLRDSEQGARGYDLLARSIEALQAFKSHMDEVNNLLRPEDENPGESLFWERFERLADRIIASQEGEQIRSVADLMEDELLPFLSAWKARIGKGT